jgi:glycosyltransferase involved in cell wall biosynthesis
MKISIITATFNSCCTIGDTLFSVQQQTYKNVEHIIIDGFSKDNTINILRNFPHTGPVLSKPNKGIYDAMNYGISVASGDIIGILNSDDFYPNIEVIEEVAKAFESGKCEAVYGDLLYVKASDTAIVVRRWIAGEYNVKEFYKGWMPPHPTFFVKKDIYEKYGAFKLEFRSSSDYELMLRFMILANIEVKYIPRVLVHMRDGGYSNRSFKNRVAAHIEDYRAWKSNGIIPKWYTVPLKPLRKLIQYAVAEKINSPFQTVSSNMFALPGNSNQL